MLSITPGEDNSSPYSFAWNSLALSNGPHTLKIKAWDTNNNMTESAVVSVTVNNIVPISLQEEKAKANPNPFQPSKGNTVLTFENLPADAVVKIYTRNGKLVTDEIISNSSGIATWQVPANIASGSYRVFVEGAGQTKKFSFSIIR